MISNRKENYTNRILSTSKVIMKIIKVKIRLKALPKNSRQHNKTIYMLVFSHLQSSTHLGWIIKKIMKIREVSLYEYTIRINKVFILLKATFKMKSISLLMKFLIFKLPLMKGKKRILSRKLHSQQLKRFLNKIIIVIH